MYYWYFTTPLGTLTIEEKENRIKTISYGKKKIQGSLLKLTPLLQKCCQELEEYLKGVRKNFSLPLLIEGTPFQKQVWAFLQEIPYGETLSYKEIAQKMQKEKAIHAVGNACHHNPIVIVIPCHRVIGKNKKLIGYNGGLDKKKYLLELEGSYGNHGN